MGLKSLASVFALVVFLLIGGFAYFRIQAGKEAISLQPVSKRQPVADLEFQNADGSRFQLADLKGKPVVVDVWASWCGPCLENLPQLDRLKQNYRDQIEILGLNVDTGGWETVERFQLRFPEVSFPYVRVHPEPLIVSTLVTIPALGPVSVLPSAFLIDAEGRLAGKYVGLASDDSATWGCWGVDRAPGKYQVSPPPGRWPDHSGKKLSSRVATKGDDVAEEIRVSEPREAPSEAAILLKIESLDSA